jgi:hypothetical protein
VHPAIPSQGAKIVWLYQPETLQLAVVVPSGPSLARAMRKAGYNAKTRNHTRNAAEIDTELEHLRSLMFPDPIGQKMAMGWI